MRNTFRYTLVPVILGANFKARLLADRYLGRYGVRSTVMSDRHHPALLLPLSFRFRRLSNSGGYTDFILSDLIRLAEEHPDKLLVLIGTTTHYVNFIREHHPLLERYYILSDPELSFLSQESATI